MTDKEIIERFPGDLRALAVLMLKKVSPSVTISLILDIEERYRGTYIYAHALDDLRREIRENTIRDDFDNLTKKMTANTAVDRLAIKNKLTARQIWNILGKEPQGDIPPTLFSLPLK